MTAVAHPRRARQRTAAIAALLLLPLIGAALAASSHPSPRFRHVAEALLFADEHSPALEKSGRPPRARLELVADVLTLPQVIEATRQEWDPATDLGGRLGVERRGAFVRVTARGRTPSDAARLANAYAAVGLSTLRALEALGGRELALGDFETSVDGWGNLPRARPPRGLARIEQATRPSKYNSGSLRVDCARVEGCGSVVRFRYPFRAKFPYRVTGWARSGRPLAPSVDVSFGASAKDPRGGRTTRKLGRRWSRFQVTWRPAVDRDVAEVALRTTGTGRSQLYLDGVSMADLAARPRKPIAQSRVFARGRLVLDSPARPIGALDGSTGLWALGGAGAGLLVAGGGIAFGLAAARRR